MGLRWAWTFLFLAACDCGRSEPVSVWTLADQCELVYEIDVQTYEERRSREGVVTEGSSFIVGELAMTGQSNGTAKVELRGMRHGEFADNGERRLSEPLRLPETTAIARLGGATLDFTPDLTLGDENVERLFPRIPSPLERGASVTMPAAVDEQTPEGSVVMDAPTQRIVRVTGETDLDDGDGFILDAELSPRILRQRLTRNDLVDGRRVETRSEQTLRQDASYSFLTTGRMYGSLVEEQIDLMTPGMAVSWHQRVIVTSLLLRRACDGPVSHL